MGQLGTTDLCQDFWVIKQLAHAFVDNLYAVWEPAGLGQP